MSERHCEIASPGGTLRGMLHLPDGAGNDVCAVIMHGYYSSNRVGPARLYVEMARRMARLGFSVLRADCLGVGDSDGDFRDTTLETECRDVLSICEFGKATVKSGRLIAVGHSMGANLALWAAEREGSIRRLVLIAPDVQPIPGGHALLTTSQLAELQLSGRTLRKGLPVHHSFYDSVEKREILDVARRVSVPCRVIHASHDELYALQGAEALTKSLTQGELRTVSSADHNFLEPSAREELLGLLIGFASADLDAAGGAAGQS